MLHSHLAMGSQELIKYFTYFEGMKWAGVGNYRALFLQRFWSTQLVGCESHIPAAKG